MSASTQFPQGKDRPADAPGGELKAGPHTRHAHLGATSMDEQSTIARINALRAEGSNVRVISVPSKGSEKTHHSSAHSATSLAPLTTQALTKELRGIVLQFRTQEVVDHTQSSLRAIENVRNGESGMSLKAFVNMCRSSPKARTLAGPLLGYGDESDPNVVQAISVLLNALVHEPAPNGMASSDGDGATPQSDAIADLFLGRR